MSTFATRLDIRGTVVLNGTGYGYVRLSPQGEKWEIRRTFVQCSTRTNEARCVVYGQQIGEQYALDGTYSGSSGDTSDTVIYLEDGQPLFVEWSGGDAGATAVVTISGWRSVPDGGFRAVH